jgi:hypothetical protein
MNAKMLKLRTARQAKIAAAKAIAAVVPPVSVVEELKK